MQYEALLVYVMFYITGLIGDCIATYGIIKKKTALRRVGCLMVAASFAVLITLLVVELCGI